MKMKKQYTKNGVEKSLIVVGAELTYKSINLVCECIFKEQYRMTQDIDYPVKNHEYYIEKKVNFVITFLTTYQFSYELNGEKRTFTLERKNGNPHSLTKNISVALRKDYENYINSVIDYYNNNAEKIHLNHNLSLNLEEKTKDKINKI